MNGIVFSSGTDGVDWAGLKAVLAADHFDNGRTPGQYRRSHENSYAVLFGYDGDTLVANGRILSDGVCNAYLVDVWTASAYRRRGIGSEVVKRLVATVPGQHVALFTDEMADFYERLGFRVQAGGMSLVAGTWLDGSYAGERG